MRAVKCPYCGANLDPCERCDCAGANPKKKGGAEKAGKEAGKAGG